MGNLKFFASENLMDLEAFLHYGCEEISNWTLDSRGGTMAIAVRQACRALQGKTLVENPLEVMNDEGHSSQHYKTWLKSSVEHSDRPLVYYESMEIAPLFLYGHYERAIEIGTSALQNVDVIWSARNGRFLMFMQGLALAGLVWSKLQDPLRSVSQSRKTTEGQILLQHQDAVKQIKSFKRSIEDWQTVNDVNYLAWSELLAAQISEMDGEHGTALEHYENALDHAAANGFVFEEALGNSLLGGFFLRTGSRRAGKGALREATTLYRALGATGV